MALAPGTDADFGANPILFEAGGKKLVGAGAKSGTFYARDRMTGAEAWKTPVTDTCRLGGILNNGAYDGARIYVASFPCTSALFPAPTLQPGQSVVAALDPATGNILWKKNVPANSWGPTAVANGVLFVAANTVVQAFNAATGDVLYTYDAKASIGSGFAVLDGQVFFGAGFNASDAFSLAGATAGQTLVALAVP
jgi:polyvinyl alcohol dehydrogenase (cytochrome)